jgi:hypothetical protein
MQKFRLILLWTQILYGQDARNLIHSLKIGLFEQEDRMKYLELGKTV